MLADEGHGLTDGEGRPASMLGPAPAAQLLALTESIHDAVISAADDHGIVFWNSGAEQLLGWSREEAIGQPLTIFMPERFHQAHRDGVARVLAGGEPHLIGQGGVEIVARHRDGHEIAVELALGRYRDGELQYFTGVLRDITGRVRQRRLDAAQDLVRRALVETGDVEQAAGRIVEALGSSLGWALADVWLVDEHGMLRCAELWADDALSAQAFDEVSRSLALAPGEGLPGMALADGVPVWIDDAPQDERFRRAGEARAAGLHAAVAIPMRSRGEVVGVIEFFLTEITGPDPELLAAMEGLCAQLATVFVRRRNERELTRRAADLERSNADLEQFASVASHDLSEPLRTISGFAALLERRYKGQLDEDADVFLGHVMAGTERMRALIDGLLAYSRASQADLDSERVELEKVVEHVQRALAAAIDESGAEIVVGDLPVVIGDAGRLGQVLQNLIANAIKFRGEDAPRVTVDAHPLDDGGWQIEVADNGSGIDPEHAERLFEMFRRGQGAADHPGEGIGLALCKRIVERHGGTIWAQPRPQGGTLVAFTLPARR